MLFTYSPDDVYAMVEAYGEKGRQAYALGAAIVDGAFPLAYAFFQAILLTFTFRRVFAKDSLMQRLHLFPFGVMINDYLENSGIIFMLLRFPDEMRGVARLTSVFTTTKWIMVGISGALVLIGLLGVSYKKLAKGSS
ncbi:MAG: hypothetical protein FVQ83_16345 [Chloroflexi bacterium]|nr:hypothetical protein [Chloroflexota bacterium]